MTFDSATLTPQQAQEYKNVSKAYENNYHYTLGDRNIDGEREIDAFNMYIKFDDMIGDIVDIGSGKKTIFNHKEFVSDRKIGDFKQGNRGDCYFLSGLKAVSMTKNGQRIIKNAIKENKDGSYTVTFKGAKQIKKKMESNGMADCPVTGVYHISEDALNRAMNSDNYSKGDKDVVIMELAMEAYNAEAAEASKMLGLSDKRKIYSGTYGTDNTKDYLDGGMEHDAILVLTGKKADIYASGLDEEKMQKEEENENQNIMCLMSAEEDSQSVDFGEDKNHHKNKLVLNYDKRAENEKELIEMMNKCIGHEDRYAVTASFNVDGEGNLLPRSADDNELHAFCVKRITEDSVELLNPWDTSKPVVISRKEFLEKVDSFNMTDMYESAGEKIHNLFS